MVLEKLDASEDVFNPGKATWGGKERKSGAYFKWAHFGGALSLRPARESNLEENVLMRIFNWTSLPDRN